MSERGVLIVFEGLDRCGKTTQCAKLVEYLNNSNRPTELMRFPERTTTIGTMINSYLTNGCDLDDNVIHLLFSANRWELSSKMKSKLSSGVTLIVDRYAYSGAAFSAAKGLDLEWCKNPDRGLPQPDAVLYLDISIEDAQKRGDYGAERYEKEEFQRAVRKNYLLLEDPRWRLINAAQTVEELHKEIVRTVEAVIVEAKDKPLTKLWVDE
eukprot:GILK01006055.1.p1 GENE.GILK01006055.1~~GILK01006055.1.p1  ORF type:complete len:225 (-),score=33.61 GILK01006055.1:292-921(-)